MMNTPSATPGPQEIRDLHRYADTDAAPESTHHTLGRGSTQAAAGNHTHDGQNSESIDIPGNYQTVQENNTSLTQRERLNFNDGISTNDGTVTVTDDAANNRTSVRFQAHGNPDTDVAAGSLHHSLGTGATQAAAGNHSHTGFATDTHDHDTDYEPIITPVAVTGSRGGNAALADLLTVLAAQGIIIDSTVV